MLNYKYCMNCEIITPHSYNFEMLIWECFLCGKELSKPEDDLEKPDKLQVGRCCNGQKR